MADYVLTQDEVESLLRASERTGELQIGFRAHLAAGHSASDAAGQAPVTRQLAGRLSREQIGSLQTRHERLARNLTVALAPLVRGMVEIKVTGVTDQRYAEFTDGLENPTCLSVLSAPLLEEKLLLEISPAIAFPMIDRMLGGGREKAVVARRPLTAIEGRLMGRITALFVHELRLAWQKVIDLNPTVERMEANPRLVQILAADDPVVVIKFEIAVGEAHGNLRLCLPLVCLLAVESAPTAQGSALGDGDRVSGSWRRDRSQTATPSVEVVAQLAKTKIRASEVANLAVGDILATDTHVVSPMILSLDGVPRFHGRPGAFQGHKAIQIEASAGEVVPRETVPTVTAAGNAEQAEGPRPDSH